jgi:hypothetical protein
VKNVSRRFPGFRGFHDKVVPYLCALLGLLGLTLLACDPNATSPLLVPTGGPGGPCTSEFTSVHMAGDFTTPPFTVSASPVMTLQRVGGVCVWRVVVTLPEGEVLYKFVTNGAFDDDFVGSEEITLAVPGGPYATTRGSGSGNAIKIIVREAGSYIFTLDERAGTWRAEEGASGGVHGAIAFENHTAEPFPIASIELFDGIASIMTTTSHPKTREFSFAGIDPGDYRLVISADCFNSEELDSVSVASAVEDVGEILLTEGPCKDCTSEFTSVRMVGDFTTPIFEIPISPVMILERVDEVCVRRVTVDLPAGPVLFKFVTNDEFDDDFVGDEATSLPVPGGPYKTSRGSGSGNAIRIEVAEAGPYVFTLDEVGLTWKAEPGEPPAPGGIAGIVEFSGLTTAPYPSARAEVFSGTSSVATTGSDPITRAFTLDGLAPGTYRVVVSATCFTTVEIPNVGVSGSTNDVGSVTLDPGASTSSAIDLVGGFNTFTPGVDPMVQSPTCTWTRERFLTAGVYPMSFIIDGQFAPYYGGDPTPVSIPGGGPVTRFESGGTALQISVAVDGTYRFVLDERLQQWSAELVTPAPTRGEEP